MGIIGSQIKPFTATAFQAGKDFFEVTDEDVIIEAASGAWTLSIGESFADVTFVPGT